MVLGMVHLPPFLTTLNSRILLFLGKGIRKETLVSPVLLSLFVLLTPSSCSNRKDLDAGYREALSLGVSFLEKDDPESALSAFDRALALKPNACPPKLGKELAYLLQFNRTTREFNRSIFGDRAPNPENLEPLSDGFVEEIIVRKLLEPLREILENLLASAESYGNDTCSLEVSLPLRYSIGTFLNFSARLGPHWTTHEGRLLDVLARALLALDHLLLSHNLEVPPVSAVQLLQTFDRSNIVGALRSFGVVVASSPAFLDWNPDPQRKALFFTIPALISGAVDQLLKIATLIQGEFSHLTFTNDREVFWVRDMDGSGTLSLGDRLVFNITGKVQVGRDPPITIQPIEFNIHPDVRPETISGAIEALQRSRDLLEGNLPPGTRIKIIDLNRVLMVFSLSNAFEDVLEVDPLVWFSGSMTATSWIRRDLNSNCAEPEGEAMICSCIPSSSDTRVLPDIIITTEAGPEELCLREGYFPVNPTYPSPPNPLPLRTILPYTYKDPFDPKANPLPVLGVEGEKSLNLLPSFYVPYYLTYGDFDHFLFDAVTTTEKEIVHLRIPRDCIEPPREDELGLITIPYFAFRDPTFNRSILVNLSVLTGGECEDSQTPKYRVWDLPDRFSINKVIAHYGNRYGSAIYQLFRFLLPP